MKEEETKHSAGSTGLSGWDGLNRRTFVKRTGGLVAGGMMASAFPSLLWGQNRKKPLNILFLMCDQHSPDALSYYGDINAITPNLDRLASTGYALRQAYCQSPVCVSSRNSILNGCYPHCNGVISNAFAGNRNILSFPQVLKRNGYTTACFGKLHTPGRDDMDWDVYIEGERTVRRPAPEGGVILAGTANLKNDPTIGAPDPYPVENTYEWQAKENTIRFMRENKDKAWMIQCSMHKPHPPWQPPKAFWDKIDRSNLIIPEFPENDLEDTDPRYRRMIEGRGMVNMSKEHILDGMQGYYGNLAYVDSLFGEVLTELERLGLRENTLVVYSVDHGEMLYNHGLWTKFVFFDQSVRVPLVFNLPGTVKEGVVSDALVENIDIFPTLMEMTGCEIPSTVQGLSLLSLLKGQTKHHRQVVYSEFPLPGKNEPGEEVQATMMRYDGRYKFIDNGPDGSPELYDHRKDPGEFINIAGQPRHRKRVERMQAELREWIKKDAVLVQPRVRDLRRAEQEEG